MSFGSLPSCLALLGDEVDGAGKILVGGREHGEDVPVAFGEQLARGAVALDHRHPVFLDDRQHRLGQAGAVGPENEFHVVLLDQPLGKLGAARRRRLVIVIADMEIVAGAPDLDAALLVHDLGREVVAVLGIGAVQGIFARLRHRGAEGDRLRGAATCRGDAKTESARKDREN